MDRDLDRNGLEVLTRADCLAFLATRQLGRVSVSIGALPVILPVTYRLTGEAVIIRTTPGTRLDAALANQVVAFEVDDLDEASGAGWSVMVTGIAEEIADDEVSWAHTLGLQPWADDAGTRFMRIRCQQISGRRVRDRPSADHASAKVVGNQPA
jgi:nitroimidazol reductase NimA-like FMN-containing flavoprotein (pyridoxamine 5'-phosphate oxidase superfamily)